MMKQTKVIINWVVLAWVWGRFMQATENELLRGNKRAFKKEHK